jgi:hypothetical protein
MLVSIVVARPDCPSHQSRTLVLKCDFCGREFSARYKRAIAEKQKHYCDRRCAWNGKKINPNVPRIRSLVCQVCGLSFEAVHNTNAPDQKTCSHSCASSLIACKLNLVSNMQTPEVRARAMKTRSEHWRDGSVVHGMRGKHFPCSEETKALLREKNSGEKNGFFGKKHTEETRQKMRESRSQLILAGRMNWKLFGHKSGVYDSQKTGKSVYFRSSWEEAVMQYLDANNEVSTWDYECMRIPYFYNDNKRWYVPDFLVTFSDGHRELWEVKPKEFVGAKKTMLKVEAARAWCQENAIACYRIIDRIELEKMV